MGGRPDWFGGPGIGIVNIGYIELGFYFCLVLLIVCLFVAYFFAKAPQRGPSTWASSERGTAQHSVNSLKNIMQVALAITETSQKNTRNSILPYIGGYY